MVCSLDKNSLREGVVRGPAAAYGQVVNQGLDQTAGCEIRLERAVERNGILALTP